MLGVKQLEKSQAERVQAVIPVSVIVPTRNEAQNLPACLASLRQMGEVYVVDSQSSDATVEIAREFGAKVVQFHYHGGWPKKRQWALNTLPFSYEWVLLVDADESLTPELISEIGGAVTSPSYCGYFIELDMHFLGRRLRHSGAIFSKLSLFRRDRGRFECRSEAQDDSMGDMEVHEHVIVTGRIGKLKNRLLHRNVHSLAHYIEKHNEYSNWEAVVWNQTAPSRDELAASLLGTQAQRRRWLRKKFLRVPGSPLAFFLYKYVFRLGFLDGVPGLIYCCLQGVQLFHIKAKLYELGIRKANC
ncbi:MAG TPA: glycosyltransferase family 2 protein [Terriglobales bacterium]|nr:glycosyltransferase family 2 protein [Terriglobales bacterium]